MLTGHQINVVRTVTLGLIFAVFLHKFRNKETTYSARCHAVIATMLILLNALSSFINGHSGYIIYGLWFYALTFLFFSKVMSQGRLSYVVLWALVIGASCAAIIAILQWLIIVYGVFQFLEPFILPPHARGGVGIPLIIEAGAAAQVRVQGTFFNPNALGPYLMISILLAYSIKIEQVSMDRPLLKTQVFLKAITMVIMSTALMLTKSRASILSFILACSIVFIGKRINGEKRKSSWPAITILVCAGLFILVNPQSKKFMRLEKGIPAREVLWAKALDIINENPLFGLGSFVQNPTWIDLFAPTTSSFGNAILEKEGHQNETLADQGISSSSQIGTMESLYSFITPHNVYLYLTIQLGLVGLISFSVLLLSILFVQVKRVRNNDLEALPLFAATIGLLFASMFDVILFASNSLTALFAWIAAASFHMQKTIHKKGSF